MNPQDFILKEIYSILVDIKHAIRDNKKELGKLKEELEKTNRYLDRQEGDRYDYEHF